MQKSEGEKKNWDSIPTAYKKLINHDQYEFIPRI